MTVEQADAFKVQVTYAGKVQELSFDRAHATVATLQLALEQTFKVPARSQKLLLPKGRKLDTADEAALLAQMLHASSTSNSVINAESKSNPNLAMTKLLLIGPTSEALSALEQEQSQRHAKHAAYQHYERHKPQPIRNTTSTSELLEREQFKFHVIRPFEKDVPQWDKRNAMLGRLAEDKAVRQVMLKHRFVVGVLTELHPLLQPTLLGLNKNAGEEISLRLLTDDLSGTRSYLEVRKVLLHELAHNRVSPHNDDFKTLNSLLNRQVLEYEAQHGIRTSSVTTVEAWNPTGDDAGVVPRGHRLDGYDDTRESVAPVSFEWSEEEQVEMRRERTRMAAEARRRREQQVSKEHK